MPFSWVKAPFDTKLQGNDRHRRYKADKYREVTGVGGTPNGMGFRVEQQGIDADAPRIEFTYFLFEWEDSEPEVPNQVLAKFKDGVPLPELLPELELSGLKTAANADGA